MKAHTQRRLATECDADFEEWFKTTEGTVHQTVNGMTSRVPAASKAIWRIAYSKGVAAILRRVNELKEST